MVDYRKVIGATVIAKACHVTSNAECSRPYGSAKSSKTLEGIVVDVVTERNEKTHRSTMKVTADYDFGGGTVKRATINIQSLVAKEREESVEIPTGMPVAPVVAAAARRGSPTSEITEINNTTATITTFPTTTMNEAESPMEVDPTVPVAFVSTPIRRNFDDNIFVETPTNATVAAGIDSPNRSIPVATAHGLDWYDLPNTAMKEVNGSVLFRDWGVRTPTGNIWRTECNIDEQISRMDVFLQMFPPVMLNTILKSTTTILKDINKKETTKGEILKFFGVVLLATKYEFTKRSTLWSNSPPSKYESAPSFGRTGMRCIRFGEQPTIRLPDMSSEKYRLLLVDEFVDSFNEHHAALFIPSDLICVDELISRWYRQGGDWINHGLPMYVAIDRKPKNGCKIQNSACGKSGVMLCLKLVKTAKEEATTRTEEHEDLLHGTVILKTLIELWNYTDRLVCADSYFASVMAAQELLKIKMRFIGVVKTATRKFPMPYLSGIELQARGDWKGLIAKDEDGKPYLLSFVWLDRERRYFITSGSSLAEGLPYFCEQWRQLD